MKKQHYYNLLIILLIISILIPNSIFIHIKKVSAAQTGTVTVDSLYVRTKASTSAEKLSMEDGTIVFLKKGETVTILDQDGKFYYVSLKFNGKTLKGYVHGDYIKLNNDATPTPKPTVTPTPTPKPTATPTSAAGSTNSITKIVEISATVTASSTLNVRSGPGTTYSKVAGLVKDDKVTVIDEKMGDDTKWYAISFKQSGKTIMGYVSSAYIQLSYKSSIKAEVSVSKVKIRKTAGSSGAYLKDSGGTVISLKEGKNVTVTGEYKVKNSDVKWFKLTVTVNDKKYTGYVEADKIRFRKTVAEPTATPTPTVEPTATPKPTPTPVPSSTPKPLVTPKPTVTPTPTGTPALYVVDNVIVYSSVTSPMSGKVCNTLYLNVFDYTQNMIINLLDSNGQPVLLQSAQAVTVNQSLIIGSDVYYQISFYINGVQKTGYVPALYINMDVNAPAVTPTPIPTPSPTPTISPDFETQLTNEGFPESYKEALRKLHVLYPNWVFKAYNTGLDWNTVISNECKPGTNLIPKSKSYEWLSFESGAYSWETDTFQPYDGTTWVTASQAAVEYYMDPRNFLTTSGIFQFEMLKYQSTYQNLDGIKKMLKSTPLDADYTYNDDNGVSKVISYAQTFLDAAVYAGVSPYHLVSRVKQEVITSSLSFSGSASGAYSGYEGYYNFYNIGASNSAGGGAVAKGLEFAKKGNTTTAKDTKYLIPWTNPYRAILGGAYFIGIGYIQKGQDTIYLQKFNVTPSDNIYRHQYMANVEAPFAEGKKVLAAYSTMLEELPIVFSIPVYKNMPKKAAPVPSVMYNPNNRLSSLQVYTASGKELTKTPTFNQTQHSYDLIVDNNVDSIKITAKAVSSKATVSGNGTFFLNVGTNTIVVQVKAQNGDISNYTVNIVRSEPKATPTVTPTVTPTITPTVTPAAQ